MSQNQPTAQLEPNLYDITVAAAVAEAEILERLDRDKNDGVKERKGDEGKAESTTTSGSGEPAIQETRRRE